MTLIPSGQKILTVSSTVDTNEKKSTQANSPSQYYTIGDIAETLTGSANLPTTTVVNILSAQILAMGSSPIELLPQPGANKYYDIEKIIIEADKDTPYVNPDNESIWIGEYDGSNYFELANINENILISSTNYQIAKWCPSPISSDITTGVSYIYGSNLNSQLLLSTRGGNNFTNGTGKLRAIITYTTRTFGA